MSAKVTLRRELRPLLEQLDDAIQAYHATNRVIADPTVTNQQCVDAGADRIHQRTVILGLAWQINKASTGRKE